MLDAIIAFILAVHWPVTDDGCPIIPLPGLHDDVVEDEPCDATHSCVDDADDWKTAVDPARLMPKVEVLDWPRPHDELIPVNLPDLKPAEPTVLVYRRFFVFDENGRRLGTTEGLITISLRSWVAIHGPLTDREEEMVRNNTNVLEDSFVVCADLL